MIELLMLKKSNNLSPVDSIGIEALAGFDNGATVKAAITQPRNIRFHRMWFALLQTVFESQTLFTTLDEMHAAIKIGVGYFEERRTLKGHTYIHPKSISFSKLDNAGFKQFFDRALDVVLTNILPNVKRADIEDRVFEILGEPRPSDLR